MPAARRSGCRVTVKRALRCALGAGLMLSATTVLACSYIGPVSVTPTVGELAEMADLVAIVRIDEQIPLSAGEQAELDRLMYSPPLDTPFSYPAPRLRFTALRVLKGEIPPAVLIQNGATTCEVFLYPGRDYVFFAKLPASDGARLRPLRGTFALDNTADVQADLAQVEAALSSSKLTHP